MTKNGSSFTVVLWNDAHTSVDEKTVDEIKATHKPSIIHTQGYVVVDDEFGISIAGEWLPGDRGGEDTYRNTTFIPRGMISEIINVKKPVKRQKKVKAAVVEGIPAAASSVVDGS